jgi:hypothetical protein
MGRWFALGLRRSEGDALKAGSRDLGEGRVHVAGMSFNCYLNVPKCPKSADLPCYLIIACFVRFDLRPNFLVFSSKAFFSPVHLCSWGILPDFPRLPVSVTSI